MIIFSFMEKICSQGPYFSISLLCPLFPFSLPFFLFFFYPFSSSPNIIFFIFPIPGRSIFWKIYLPVLVYLSMIMIKFQYIQLKLLDFHGLKKLARRLIIQMVFSQYSKVWKFKHFFLPYIAYACIFQQQLNFRVYEFSII